MQRRLKGASMMNILLLVVVFAALIGTIADSFAAAVAAGNVTGAAATIIGLGTLIVCVIFIRALVKNKNVSF